MNNMLNNADLYRYLLGLHELLRSRGVEPLANRVQHACLFAMGSQTEFAAEARNALHTVIESQAVLSDAEVTELRGWLGEIDDAFKAIGGA